MLGMKRDCGGAAGILGGFRAAVKQVSTKTQNNNNIIIKTYLLTIGHVRYINILTWLGGFQVKIANFSNFFCLSIPKRDLDTKKTRPNIEV